MAIKVPDHRPRPPLPVRVDRSLQLSLRQRRNWLRLIRCSAVGPALFRILLNQFGSAEASLQVLPELSLRGGALKKIHIPDMEVIDAEMEALERLGGRFVAIGEEAYPQGLRMIDAPPPLLAMLGTGKALLEKDCVAIVGGRNCSLAGQKFATQIAKELSSIGLCIVSGLARGIDTAAHTVSCAGGTIAAMAGGVDVIYPPENKALSEKIIACGGALVSELPLSYKPRAQDFPRRNRLISGMSLGVILIEAAERSGSLHTARFALDQGREVFAVPGFPLDPRSTGCNNLIRQGACLVTKAEHVLEVLRSSLEFLPFDTETPSCAPLEEKPLSHAFSELDSITKGDRARIVGALGSAPIGVDEICAFLDIPIRSVQIVLLELELAGRLERHRGQKVSLLGGG